MDNFDNVLWDAQLYAPSRSVDSDNLKVGKQASTLIASAPGNCSYQLLRCLRGHLSEEIDATEFCGFEYCAYHLHVWTQSDADDGGRPPSESEFSDQTEPFPQATAHGFSSDDEEAFAAAETLEALSETGQP